MHIPDQESRGHISPTSSYFVILGILLVLTIATVAASYVNWGAILGGGFALNITIAMIIASVKAYLVLMYFMHMKYEDKLVWGYGIFYPIILFAILLGFQILDEPLRRVPPTPKVILEQAAGAQTAPAAASINQANESAP